MNLKSVLSPHSLYKILSFSFFPWGVVLDGMLGNLDKIACNSSSFIFSNSFKLEVSSLIFSTLFRIFSTSESLFWDFRIPISFESLFLSANKFCKTVWVFLLSSSIFIIFLEQGNSPRCFIKLSKIIGLSLIKLILCIFFFFILFFFIFLNYFSNINWNFI